jgi:ubiquinone/menaquinone biosynthesis C-methylase UbiE
MLQIVLMKNITSIYTLLRAKMTTFKFHEFDIPIDLLNKTGGGIDTFEIISQMHMNLLEKFIGINKDHSLLEIGCGIGRDAIPLTKILSKEGKYVGVDIIKPSIDFCNENISKLYPNFNFVHFNVKDQLHNPDGSSQMIEYKLPMEDKSVDRIFAWSVFTHMYEEDIQYYLKEFKRVLKDDGEIYTTCFIITDDVLKKARETNLTIFDLRFEHKLSEDCFINDPNFPLGAIGYSPARWKTIIDKSGLKLKRNFVQGVWCGYYEFPEDGQDGLVLCNK